MAHGSDTNLSRASEISSHSRFEARELPGEVALARDVRLERLLAGLVVGLGRGEPRFDALPFGRRARPSRARASPSLSASGFFCAYSRWRASASARFCALRLPRRAGVGGLRGRRPPASREHPVAVVVEIAVERHDAAVGDEPERVGRGAQQVAVVRDDDERAVVILQRLGERLAHLDVEVIGGLVQQQQVGLLPDEQREREPRFLAAGKAADRMR